MDGHAPEKVDVDKLKKLRKRGLRARKRRELAGQSSRDADHAVDDRSLEELGERSRRRTPCR